MIHRFTLVFPDTSEHRFSEHQPEVGETVEIRGRAWVVSEAQGNERYIMRPLASDEVSAAALAALSEAIKLSEAI